MIKLILLKFGICNFDFRKFKFSLEEIWEILIWMCFYYEKKLK